ncbi:MAG: ABC transporter ATP-binding protein [Acetobacteraceae bacterium]|nr:ABC transporter ATP-binding protein [Acetobacteraceae bacterium]
MSAQAGMRETNVMIEPPALNATNVLQVHGLNLYLDAKGRRLHVVRSVDIDLAASEVLGLIGESGSGKTMTGLSLLRLEPERAQITAETMRLDDTDLLAASQGALRGLRGSRIAMIFQDPVGAFNPAKRIGWHAREVLRRRATRAGPWRPVARELLAEVDIADADRVLGSYPHQLSGGMLQRVLIALVLAAEPQVIIADEPTTNLDNIVEQQILRLFRKVKRTHGAAFIFITHDMSVAAALSDRIAVMYAGEIVEVGPTEAVFETPKHPYTVGLIRTSRALQDGAARLPEIAGELPGLSGQRTGCAFAPRCPERMPQCTTRTVGMARPAPGVQARCLLYADA